MNGQIDKQKFGSDLAELTSAISLIKSAILQSRYRAASLANRELLSLYYGIGKYISENSRVRFWGTNAIETISVRLQQELPGLRGFSAGNMRKMRIFYEEWKSRFKNRAASTHNLENTDIQPVEKCALVTHEISVDLLLHNRPLIEVNCDEALLNLFLQIGFTHHYEILKKCLTFEERLFYIEKCALEFWTVDRLKDNLKANLFSKRGKFTNNFGQAISEEKLLSKALLSFKDEYLFDYINIEDPTEETDERVLEQEIVNNIKKFIMSLGKDFSFMGNQYRLIVSENEYYIDILFYNRQLQSLVAIELKRGDFKPEYLGKMNFYLSALDDLVRLPHENRSIGIILCKSQKQNIVEYAFRDLTKPMGVATYKTRNDLPEQYRNILPNPEELRELL